jgi:cytochrome c5
MKKFIVLFIAAATIAVACHKKAAPTASANTNTNPTSTSTNSNASQVPVAPVTAAVVYTSADIDAGKVIYETKCTKCHPAKPVDSFNEDRWVKILKSMIPKAKLDSVQSHQVTAYAMTNAKK